VRRFGIWLFGFEMDLESVWVVRVVCESSTFVQNVL
jgi:hypothetical protein